MRELFFGTPDAAAVTRAVAVERPVAIEVNGIGYAVMMASPGDLDDYAVGFALSEGLIEHAAAVLAIDAQDVAGGIVLRLTLPNTAMTTVVARARHRVSESSCGLCGMDNIAQVLRPLPPVGVRERVTRDAVARALKALRDHQPLARATGATHAAAFCAIDGAIVLVREDVGRHNALDKLIGALARADVNPATGFILLTARCSYELVEKAVRAGCPILVTISAPTSLAVERARAAGLTLATLARRDSMLVANDPAGMFA